MVPTDPGAGDRISSEYSDTAAAEVEKANAASNRAFLLAVLLIAFNACSTATNTLVESAPFPNEATLAANEQRYSTLVASIKQDPRPELLADLRRVYILTNRYQPYAGGDPSPIFAEADAKRWTTCLERTASALDENYTDLWAHLGAMVCNRESGNTALASFHDKVVKGLLEAILTTGDGKTTDTAFHTYSVPELRAFLVLHGLKIDWQALTERDEKGRIFDIMTVHDPDTGERRSLYFNVTYQFTYDAWRSSPGGPRASTSAK